MLYRIDVTVSLPVYVVQHFTGQRSKKDGALYYTAIIPQAAQTVIFVQLLQGLIDALGLIVLREQLLWKIMEHH